MRRVRVVVFGLVAGALAASAAAGSARVGSPGTPRAEADRVPLEAVGSVTSALRAAAREHSAAADPAPITQATTLVGSAPDIARALPIPLIVDLVVEPTTGRLFVGGADRILALGADGTVLATIAGAGHIVDLEAKDGIVYGADDTGHRIVRVDAASATALGALVLPGTAAPAAVAVARGVVWYLDGDALRGVDPVTAAPITSVAGVIPSPGPDHQMLWSVPDNDDVLLGYRFDINGDTTFTADLRTTPPTLTGLVACAGAYAGPAVAPLPGGTEYLGLALDRLNVGRLSDHCGAGRRYGMQATAPSTGASTAQLGGLVAVGSSYASGSPLDPEVLLFRADSEVPFRAITVEPRRLRSPMTFSADGTRLFATGADTDFDQTTILYVTLLDDVAVPVITDLDPPFGESAGGTRTTITGSNLRNVDQVTFGGVPGTGVEVLSPTSVSVVVPPLAPGSHTVTLRNTRGTSAPSAAATYVVRRELGSFGEFTPLPPTRLLDTRAGVGAAAGAVTQGGVVDLAVLGVGGVPAAGVSAVVLNVTVTEPTSAGYLTVYPTGAERPLASNLNFEPGRTVPNLVVARVGAGGSVSFFNSSGSTHVLADLAGFYSTTDGPPGTRFHPIAPVRVIDTRPGGRPLGAGQTGFIDLLEGSTEPMDRLMTKAWVMNVTATEATGSTFLTVFPYNGDSRPLASSLNVQARQTVANLVMVGATSGGWISFYNNSGSVHVVADVIGWYDLVEVGDAGRFVPLERPARRLDTREAGALGAGGSQPVALAGTVGLPDAVFLRGVVANLTATGATAPTFVTLYPSEVERPLASNLNLGARQTVPNLATVATGGEGSITAFNWAGSVDLILDVVGWFTSSVGGFAFD